VRDTWPLRIEHRPAHHIRDRHVKSAFVYLGVRGAPPQIDTADPSPLLREQVRHILPLVPTCNRCAIHLDIIKVSAGGFIANFTFRGVARPEPGQVRLAPPKVSSTRRQQQRRNYERPLCEWRHKTPFHSAFSGRRGFVCRKGIWRLSEITELPS
jgi:hypothetical protein